MFAFYSLKLIFFFILEIEKKNSTSGLINGILLEMGDLRLYKVQIKSDSCDTPKSTGNSSFDSLDHCILHSKWSLGSGGKELGG